MTNQELHEGGVQYARLAHLGEEEEMADLFRRLADKYGMAETSREFLECLEASCLSSEKNVRRRALHSLGLSYEKNTPRATSSE